MSSPSASAAAQAELARDDNAQQVVRRGAAPVVNGDLPFVARLRADPELTLTGFAMDVPVLREPRVRAALGSKGPTFARNSIVFETYVRAAGTPEAAIEAAVAFSTECEGPPGCVHGGALATALDSLLGFTSVRLGGTGHVTLQLDTTYKEFVPLGATVLGRARIDKHDGRKLYLSGELLSGDDTPEQPAKVHVRAKALFYCTTAGEGATYDQLVRLLGPESGVTTEQVLEQIELRKRKTGRVGLIKTPSTAGGGGGSGGGSAAGGGATAAPRPAAGAARLTVETDPATGTETTRRVPLAKI